MPCVLTVRSHIYAPFRVRSDAGTRSPGLGPELGWGGSGEEAYGPQGPPEAWPFFPVGSLARSEPVSSACS